jgi:antitoxin component YwqK of YwqJK toxin-antitoxin module
MTQFTSSLDFSLTKKRLLMMGKQFSKITAVNRVVILAPLLFVSVLMFCTQSEQEKRIFHNRVETYTEPEFLYDEHGTEFDDTRRNIPVYDGNGVLFNGTRRLLEKGTDKLLAETVFEGGILLSVQFYDQRISQNIQRQVVHREGSDKLIAENYDWNNELMGKHEYIFNNDTVVISRRYLNNDVLADEWIDQEASDDGLGHIREWHPNGQLKYEVAFKDSLRYHGLMSLYDEQGNIMEQERYENGELIEKIK